MADISGIIQAANMGIQNNQYKRSARQQASQYAGEYTYRKNKDEQDRQDEIRKEKIQSDQFNRTLSETEGFHNMSMLLDMYGEVMANERAAMAGPIDKGENTDLWSKFQEGMGFVSGINEDWYTPENLASYKQVYFDPEMRDKATQDFEEWLKSVPNQNDKTVLRSWFQRALREGEQKPDIVPTPEPDPIDVDLPPGTDLLAMESAVSGLGSAGVGLPASVREEYERELAAEEAIKNAPEGYQSPFAASIDTDFTRRGLGKNTTDWDNLKADVDALLRNLPRDITPEQQAQITEAFGKATRAGLIQKEGEVTEAELRTLKEFLGNLLGGR